MEKPNTSEKGPVIIFTSDPHITENWPIAYITEKNGKTMLFFGKVVKVIYDETPGNKKDKEIAKRFFCSDDEDPCTIVREPNMMEIGSISWAEFSEARDKTIMVDKKNTFSVPHNTLSFLSGHVEELVKPIKFVPLEEQVGKRIRLFKNVDCSDYGYLYTSKYLPVWFLGYVTKVKIYKVSPITGKIVSDYEVVFDSVVPAVDQDGYARKDVQGKILRSLDYYSSGIPVDVSKFSEKSICEDYWNANYKFEPNKYVYRVRGDLIEFCTYPKPKDGVLGIKPLQAYRTAFLEAISKSTLFKMTRETIRNVIAKDNERSSNFGAFKFGFTYKNKDGTGNSYVSDNNYHRLNFDVLVKRGSAWRPSFDESEFLDIKKVNYTNPDLKPKMVVYVLKGTEMTETDDEPKIKTLGFIKADDVPMIDDFMAFVNTRGQGKRFSSKSDDEVRKMFLPSRFYDIISAYFDPEYSQFNMFWLKMNFLF